MGHSIERPAKWFALSGDVQKSACRLGNAMPRMVAHKPHAAVLGAPSGARLGVKERPVTADVPERGTPHGLQILIGSIQIALRTPLLSHTHTQTEEEKHVQSRIGSVYQLKS